MRAAAPRPGAVAVRSWAHNHLERTARRGVSRSAQGRRGGGEAAHRRPQRTKRAQSTIASESVYSSSGYAAVSTNTTGVCRSTTHTCDHETHKGHEQKCSFQHAPITG